MKRMRAPFETYTTGVNLRGAGKDKWIVKWDPKGRTIRLGPSTSTYWIILIMLLF